MKITPREGDYVITVGLTEAQHQTLINIFIGCGFLAGESTRGYSANYFKCIGIINGKIHYSDCPDKYGRELSLSDLLGDKQSMAEFLGTVPTIESILKDYNASWSGEGSPPAGTKCQIDIGNGFISVDVAAITKSYVVISHEGQETAILLKRCEFRPLKSEREIAIEEISALINNCAGISNIAAAIYDAGYRMVEK